MKIVLQQNVSLTYCIFLSNKLSFDEMFLTNFPGSNKHIGVLNNTTFSYMTGLEVAPLVTVVSVQNVHILLLYINNYFRLAYP